MKIILTEKIEKLGDIGDQVSVKNGYARNYLIPQEKALIASEENQKIFEEQKKVILAKNEEIKKEAKKIFDKINNKNVLVIVQASDEGRLYGSVMPKDIAEKISAAFSTEIKKSQIILATAIREIGIYSIKVRIHADFLAEVNINIARSESEAKANEKKAKELTDQEEAKASIEENTKEEKE
jgi:large subunit ribosomal protein L9